MFAVDEDLVEFEDADGAGGPVVLEDDQEVAGVGLSALEVGGAELEADTEVEPAVAEPDDVGGGLAST